MSGKKKLRRWVDDMLMNDEISLEEEAFLTGYLELEE